MAVAVSPKIEALGVPSEPRLGQSSLHTTIATTVPDFWNVSYDTLREGKGTLSTSKVSCWTRTGFMISTAREDYWEWRVRDVS